tara:strand:+ start:1596 stop:1844 length:249 start_codon:yes stop_codon:yes gene_type:complete
MNHMSYLEKENDMTQELDDIERDEGLLISGVSPQRGERLLISGVAYVVSDIKVDGKRGDISLISLDEARLRRDSLNELLKDN